MDYSKYIEEVATQGVDMTKVQSGGGGASTYVPPPPGLALLRLVGYVECGIQHSVYLGQEKNAAKVQLVFELHGKNYPPREFQGEIIPQRITVIENLSLHEKSNFRKIFDSMRGGDESVRHFSQLLGRGFMGRVFNEKNAKDPTKTYARLRDANGYQITQAFQDDAVTGERRSITVPPAISKLRLFIWDFADKEMWDSIYIDGDYGPGQRTKNVFQEMILKANNFKGSPIDRALNGANAGVSLDNLAAETVSTNGASHFRARMEAKTETPAPADSTPAPTFGRRRTIATVNQEGQE